MPAAIPDRIFCFCKPASNLDMHYLGQAKSWHYGNAVEDPNETMASSTVVKLGALEPGATYS